MAKWPTYDELIQNGCGKRYAQRLTLLYDRYRAEWGENTPAKEYDPPPAKAKLEVYAPHLVDSNKKLVELEEKEKSFSASDDTERYEISPLPDKYIGRAKGGAHVKMMIINGEEVPVKVVTLD